MQNDMRNSNIYARVFYYMFVPLLQQTRKIYDTPAVKVGA